MYSILKQQSAARTGIKLLLGAGALWSAVGATGGCTRNSRPNPDAYNDTPLIVDEAMQRREWDPTLATYPSGDTVASPTGFWYRPKDDMGYVERQLVEVPLFIGQVFMMPYTMIEEPLTDTKVYPGAIQESTYTASPPLETDVQMMARQSHYYD
jgi:hypothetical protein